MNLLFITDPLQGFKLDKDSSLAMMRQAQQRGHAVWVCSTPDLQWQRGERVSALMQRLQLKDHAHGWYHIEETSAKVLSEMDAVLMRGTKEINWKSPAIDAVLADGNWHTRDELLRAAAVRVPPGQAWRTGESDRRRTTPGERIRGDDHTTIASGARRSARYVLKSAVHWGAIERGPDGLYRAKVADVA
jgi:hypothetical protein